MTGMMPVIDTLSFEPGANYASGGIPSSRMSTTEGKLLRGSVVWAPLATMAALGVGASGVIGAVTSHRYYRAYGFVKRPAITWGVWNEIQGARTLMFVSKSYSKLMLGVGIIGYKRNIALARQKEWKRLGINVFGPPFSLALYDMYMSETGETRRIIEAGNQINIEESRRGRSLPSRPKTRGKHSSYKPKAGRKCAPGYRKVGGRCVKK